MSVCGHAAANRLIVCSHVIEDGEPIHTVFHETDGEWQAVCEHGGHDTPSEGRVICFNCFRERYPDFEAVSGLYRGGQATAIMSEPGRWWVQPIEDIGSAQ